ncbi:TetR/AcrR family transcriptional regulator C-terminal domain-containing protein [Sphaerisporangium fuscum]|uniref:TetR/AcrR family transcriptional regulator C-terminal domain-containing protein n=1 Tax=Sphaerisporangium fuscum TaxID=2835868 RepID=UPI001BDD713C|nr:TetR/AcrR family transcriptional regulator C-terminal domain-containing protein [Sphaerisporangium fuscum]
MDRPAPQSEPPYLRIVREIRRRIATGELRAGDRVPSTRQITQEWGVAMATATKALNTLRQEGLVHAVPGVGTVVHAPEPPRPAARSRESRESDHDLTRERIVRTGVEIADGEGLAALSMRRIATELGAATMSLYRHVAGKNELVALMADAVFGDEPLVEARPGNWREGLESTARTHWRMYRRHPWLAQVMSFTRPLMAPKGLAHTERALRHLDGLGLPPNTLLHLAVTTFSYVRGVAVNLEQEAQARQDTGVSDDEWMESQEQAFARVFATGDFPAVAAVFGAPGVDFDLDSLFEFGLRSLLDGFAVLVETAASAGPG